MASTVRIVARHRQRSFYEILSRITIPEAEATPVVPSPKSGKSTSTKSSLHPFNVKWEKRKKVGYAPGKRVGCTMAAWTTRNMGILFGGVTDEDNDEETLESVYHNDL